MMISFFSSIRIYKKEGICWSYEIIPKRGIAMRDEEAGAKECHALSSVEARMSRVMDCIGPNLTLVASAVQGATQPLALA